MGCKSHPLFTILLFISFLLFLYYFKTFFFPICSISAEILQANDNLTQVINLYKQLVRGEEINGEVTAGPLRGEETRGAGGIGRSSTKNLLLVSSDVKDGKEWEGETCRSPELDWDEEIACRDD